MIYIRTGRFEYDLNVEDAKEARIKFRKVHDEIMDIAEEAHIKNKSVYLEKVLGDCWDNIQQIEAAIEPLSEDRKALIFHLFEHRMIDAFEVAQSAYDARSPNRSKGGVKLDVSQTIDAAIKAEVERAGKEGRPVDLGNAARVLEAKGIPRKWRALHRRMTAMGVVLPTTSKSALSSAGRQP